MDVQRAVGLWSISFFVFLTVIGNYVLLSLVVALLLGRCYYDDVLATILLAACYLLLAQASVLHSGPPPCFGSNVGIEQRCDELSLHSRCSLALNPRAVLMTRIVPQHHPRASWSPPPPRAARRQANGVPLSPMWGTVRLPPPPYSGGWVGRRHAVGHQQPLAALRPPAQGNPQHGIQNGMPSDHLRRC